MSTIAAGLSDRAREIHRIHQRRLCVCAVFRDGHGKECSPCLSFYSTICTYLFSCFYALFKHVSSNTACQKWAIVSLAIIGDGDFKCWGSGQFHCTFIRWPAHRLRLFRWNNSCVECHNGRDSGGPIEWTLESGHVCGILSRWPAHRLRLLRWNNSCVEHHDGRDSGGSIYWTLESGHVCGILSRWPAHCLRLLRSNNSCVERHDGRDSGGPIEWTLEFGLVCGILSRWPAHHLRLFRWNNSCVE